jgi:hypothetical protein
MRIHFLFIIITVLLIIKHFKENDLLECHKFTTGKITAVLDGPGAKGTRYSYYVSGKKYTGTTTGKYYYELTYLEFPVIYSCEDPGFSIILIEPTDFEKYGYNFPDSLYYVLERIRK